MDKSKMALDMLKSSAKSSPKQSAKPAQSSQPTAAPVDARNNGLNAIKAAAAPMMQASQDQAPQAVLTVGDQTLSTPQDIADYVMNDPEIMSIIEASSQDQSSDAQAPQQMGGAMPGM